MQQNDWNNIKFSEQEKQQLTEKIYTTMQQSPKHQKIFYKPLRPIAVALLLMIFISVAGYAATTIRNVINENFKGTPTANTNFEQNITYLGITETWNGWSLTLTDVIGDYSDIWIGFELKTPEHITLNHEQNRHYCFEEIRLSPNHLDQGINQENIKLIDAHTLTGLFKLNTYGTNHTKKPEFQNKTISFSFSGFHDIYSAFQPETKTYEYVTCSKDYEEINKHTFSFKNIPLDYKTMEITLTPNDKVSVFQGEATITKIIISPISVTARVEGEGCKDHHYKPTSRPEAYRDSTLKALDGSVYNEGCLRELGLKVIYKDGSEVEFSQSSGSCDDKTKPYYLEKTQRTKQIIDLDNIAYIEVCGRRYTIPRKIN